MRDARPRKGTRGDVLAENQAVSRSLEWTRVPARARADVPVLYPRCLVRQRPVAPDRSGSSNPGASDASSKAPETALRREAAVSRCAPARRPDRACRARVTETLATRRKRPLCCHGHHRLSHPRSPRRTSRRAVSPACRTGLLRPGHALADAGATVVAPPAEADLVWLRLERRARKVARRKLHVVLRGGEVVRTIGMEQRS
jgi:hypothetical protein